MGLSAAEHVQLVLAAGDPHAQSEYLDGDHVDYVGGHFRADVRDEGRSVKDKPGYGNRAFGGTDDAGLWLRDAGLDLQCGSGHGAGDSDGDSADDVEEVAAADEG